MATFVNLPQELVAEILSWLPADALIRFKCVCKSWRALISDRDFVTKHLGNVSRMPHSMSLFVVTYRPRNYLMLFIKDEQVKSFLSVFDIYNHDDDDDDDESDRTDSAIEDPMLPLFRRYKEYWFPFLSSQCDGIFCLHRETIKDVLICNPVTRESKFLSGSCFDDDFVTFLLGLGYASIVGSYKIIRVVCHKVTAHPFRAEVCTLGTGSWREIEINVLPRETESISAHYVGVMNMSKERYCKGFYYWLVSFSSEKDIIISFDFCKEEFHSIALPDDSQTGGDWMYRSLDIWNESIALFYYPKHIHNIRPIEMWVMVGSSVGPKDPCSWTKYLTFDLLEGIRFPIAFSTRDELLMRCKDGRVISYNLHTRKVRSLSIPPLMVSNAFVFLKTLVSIH